MISKERSQCCAWIHIVNTHFLAVDKKQKLAALQIHRQINTAAIVLASLFLHYFGRIWVFFLPFRIVQNSVEKIRFKFSGHSNQILVIFIFYDQCEKGKTGRVFGEGIRWLIMEIIIWRKLQLIIFFVIMITPLTLFIEIWGKIIFFEV